LMGFRCADSAYPTLVRGVTDASAALYVWVSELLLTLLTQGLRPPARVEPGRVY